MFLGFVSTGIAVLVYCNYPYSGRLIIYDLKLMNGFRYIQENYTKIRDVERELANLSMEMKLTAGPKKSGCCLIVVSYSYSAV